MYAFSLASLPNSRLRRFIISRCESEREEFHTPIMLFYFLQINLSTEVACSFSVRCSDCQFMEQLLPIVRNHLRFWDQFSVHCLLHSNTTAHSLHSPRLWTPLHYTELRADWPLTHSLTGSLTDSLSHYSVVCPALRWTELGSRENLIDTLIDTSPFGKFPASSWQPWPSALAERLSKQSKRYGRRTQARLRYPFRPHLSLQYIMSGSYFVSLPPCCCYCLWEIVKYGAA
jgi:hypothetical protein